MPRPRAVADKELLDAAMFAFWAKGYGGVSTRELESATGLPASSLYHRHGSKEGLFTAALAHYIDRVVARRIDRYLGEPDARAGLRAFLTSVYRDGARHGYHACLLANTAGDPSCATRAVRAELARGNALLRDAFAANVRRGQAAGQFDAALDAGAAARYLLLVLQGLLLTARGERDAARLDALVDIALAGLRTAATSDEGIAS
jgi:TetR/AcrR family transcriptional repressor of nem operon